MLSPPTSVHLEAVRNSSLAQREIHAAWEQYKQSTIKCFSDGLEFGRSCFEWRAKYTAQGSRSGKGFEHLLEQLAIPKTTAYRWIRCYEMKKGLRANRDEVEGGILRPHLKGRSNIRTIEKRISFHFFLRGERQQQFAEDLKLLGGRKKVTEMFLDFVSRKATQKRAFKVSSVKASQYHEGARNRALGAFG